MHTLTFKVSVQDTVEALQTAIGNSGMLLLGHINGQANAPAVRILHVFRPELAVRVWRTHPPAGIEIPVRVYVYENANGHSLVNYRSLLEAMAPYNIQELSDVGRETDTIFATIMQNASSACEELV
jgi:uncharacterized protein (DUF302 family)